MSLWLRHRPYELRPIFISAANFPSRGFRKNLQALHSQKCLIRNVQVRAAVESPPRDKGHPCITQKIHLGTLPPGTGDWSQRITAQPQA